MAEKLLDFLHLELCEIIVKHLGLRVEHFARTAWYMLQDRERESSY